MFILLILSVIILFIDFQHYIYDWTTSCAFFTVWPKDSQIAVLTLKIKMWPMSELTTYQMSMAIIKAGVKKWRGSKQLSEVKRSKAETGLMYRSINLWRAGVTVITKIDKVEGCTTVWYGFDLGVSYNVWFLNSSVKSFFRCTTSMLQKKMKIDINVM